MSYTGETSMKQISKAEEDYMSPLIADSPNDKNHAADCCFGHCVKHTACNKKVTCFTWKRTFDKVVCCAAVMVLLSLLFAVIVPLAFHYLEVEGIAEEVVIDGTDAPSYDIWQSNIYGSSAKDKPVIHYDVYIFDLQNPMETLNGSKPVVTERGPYAFHEYYNKFDISWSDGGNIVSYRSQRFYVFDAERTGPGLSLSDRITIPYGTVIGFEYLLGTISEDTQEMIDYEIDEKLDAKVAEIEAEIDKKEQDVIDNPMPDEMKNKTLAELEQLRLLVEVVAQDIENYIDTTDLGTTLLKLLMCGAQGEGQIGISPYWVTDPVSAYFGWLNDPILVEVQRLLYATNNSDTPWSTSVPGATSNYTSEDDARRRAGVVVQKTGKDNTARVGQYVSYYNQTSQWVCLDTTKTNPQLEGYVQGENFPSCYPYQTSWTAEEAVAMGYVQPFVTDYANRIDGTDGNMFGAPTISDKVQVYISDIYRTAYLQFEKDTTDWHGVTLRRYQLQMKDLGNETVNPSEAWEYNSFGPSGMENLTTVAGAPLFASKPHFLDGSTSLAASVVGMVPRREVHDTYLDIEPNTGALVRAHKRLQLVYEMTNVHLPAITQEAVIAIDEICRAVNTSDCLMLDAALQCLNTPSEWKFYNDRVYLPYAWADEYTTGTHQNAQDIKTGIYDTDNFATEIQRWCYVIAGIMAAFITGLYISKHLWQKDREMGRESFVSFNEDDMENN